MEVISSKIMLETTPQGIGIYDLTCTRRYCFQILKCFFKNISVVHFTVSITFFKKYLTLHFSFYIPTVFLFLVSRNLEVLSSYSTPGYGAVAARLRFPLHFLASKVSEPIQSLAFPTLALRELFWRLTLPSDGLLSIIYPESPLRDLCHAVNLSVAIWTAICLLSHNQSCQVNSM